MATKKPANAPTQTAAKPAVANAKAASATPKQTTVSEPAKHGGQAVRDKYGLDFFAQIGKIGGQTVKERRGPEFYAQIGRQGGESTKKKYGSDFYSQIGRKGGSTVRTEKKLKTDSTKN